MFLSYSKFCTALLFAFGLSACGGGGGTGSGGTDPVDPIDAGDFDDSTTVPIASTGFATAASTFDSNVNFSPLNDGIWTRTVFGSSVAPRPASFSMEFSDNGDAVAVFIRGQQYDLTRISSTQYSGTRTGVPTPILLTILQTSDNGDARLGRVENESETFGKEIHFVYGFDTLPSTVQAETGTVTYAGDVIATALQGTAEATAGGVMTLRADFDNNRMTGDLSLDAFSGIMGTATYELSETDITGDGFIGFLREGADELDPGQSLGASRYEGNFYGTDASSAGGAIRAEISDSGEEPIYLQGGFLTEAQ